MAGLWKDGNSPIPNNPGNFLETECEQNQLDSPFFSANFVFVTPMAGNDPRIAETPQQNHTNTHTYTIHPTNQTEITTQVSSIFQAHQGAQADEGRKTETYPHTHTPTHTHTLQKRLSSGSVRAQTLQVLAQLGVTEASESQIQAVKTAVTSASANNAMPESLMQMGDYPRRIHADQQNPLRQKTAINEPAEAKKSHAMQIVVNFPCAQDALSCTSLQMGAMTAAAQQPVLSRHNAYLFPHDVVGSVAESQIQAVKTAVTSASANNAMPESQMQMGDYPGRIHASQQNQLRQKTAINEPAEAKKSHAMQIVVNFPCAQDALSCTSLQMGAMTASAQGHAAEQLT